MNIKDLTNKEIQEQVELFRNRIETLSQYISETEDQFTRSNMESMLYRYKLTYDALLQEHQIRSEYVDDIPVDLGDFLFNSSDHLRYQNGIHVSGPHEGGAGRAIKIENNISGLSGYTVTIFNLEGEHPVWQNNVQMAPKQMKIIQSNEKKIVLRGFGQDLMGASFADYGLSIIHDDGDIEKCILHLHDRNIDIEYLKNFDERKNDPSNNFYTKEFISDWERAYSVRVKILNSQNVIEVERIFESHKIHPLTIYGRLDKALLFFKDRLIINDSMERILQFVKTPFPNVYFDSPCNDPIGEVMLKPLINYPFEVAPVNDPNLLNYLNWILVGYAYLYKSYQEQGIAAYDSLRTMGIAIEQNSDDFAFIIFGGYLDNRPNYAVDYTKFLVFCLSNSGLGFKKHGGNVDESNRLIDKAKTYSSWLQSKETSKDWADFIDEGKEIASHLFESVMNDIKSGKISLDNLKPIIV